MGAGLCPTGNGENSKKEGKRQAGSMSGECEAIVDDCERRRGEGVMESVGAEAARARASLL